MVILNVRMQKMRENELQNEKQIENKINVCEKLYYFLIVLQP